MTDPAKQPPPLNWAAMVFLLKETWQEWNDDNVPRLGAALAFYSILSIGPLLLIVVSLAGLAFGDERASQFIFYEISGLVGIEGASAIRTILTNSTTPASSYIATAIGIVTLVISATGFFAQLQDSLNTIWNVEGSRADIVSFFRKRMLSFGMILGIALLLLLALVVSAALSAITAYFVDLLPGLVMHGVNLVGSFAAITFLFAIIFKVLPDVRIRWKDVWLGAAITALLFSIGKTLIGIYLGQSAFSSTYGAAGSLMVVLVWIYYSTQIFFIGAEFTQVYTRYLGRQIVIKKGRRKPVNTAKEVLKGAAAKNVKAAVDVVCDETKDEAAKKVD